MQDGDGIVDSITKIDQYTVQFQLKEAAPRFLPIMAYTAGSIVSKDWVTSKGCGYPAAGVQCTSIEKEVMGTGPYMMNEDYGGKWVPEQYVLVILPVCGSIKSQESSKPSYLVALSISSIKASLTTTP